MEESQEIELIARVAQGDESAFRALYHSNVDQAYSVVLSIVRDPMMAEEVTQDSFLKLWSRACLYRAERGTVRAWLSSIARRTALDRLRLEARRPALSEAGDPEDGSLQATYNGWPLYYFYLDFKPGDVKGQGSQDAWYVISPAGAMIIE